jgi:acyl dehydratase
MNSPVAAPAPLALNMAYGRYFDELEVGREFRHWPGRTITEFDDTLFSLMSMNQHPVHVDEHYARETQHGRRLVVGPLVISLAVGLSQVDVGGRALETLSYSGVRHLAPVFHGDTGYAESSIVAKEELPDNRGIVIVATTALNQRGEAILSMQRRLVLPKRPAGEAPCAS